MQFKLTLNVKVTLNINCECQQSQEKCPADHYLYFEHAFRKWDCFCLNVRIFKDQKIMFISQKRIF